MNYSENDYVFFILLHLEKRMFMSHKTSSHFLPHQIFIERDYEKGISLIQASFLWELIKNIL